MIQSHSPDSRSNGPATKTCPLRPHAVPQIQAPLGLAIFEMSASLPYHVLPLSGLCCPVTSQLAWPFLVLSPALWPLLKSLHCPGHSQPHVLTAGASTCGSDTPLCALSVAFAGPTQCPKVLQRRYFLWLS